MVEGSAACLSPMLCSCVRFRSMLPVSYYLLIPSLFRPLMGGPLDLSVLKQTWESLGPQVTSSVSPVSLLPLSLPSLPVLSQ